MMKSSIVATLEHHNCPGWCSNAAGFFLALAPMEKLCARIKSSHFFMRAQKTSGSEIMPNSEHCFLLPPPPTPAFCHLSRYIISKVHLLLTLWCTPACPPTNAGTVHPCSNASPPVLNTYIAPQQNDDNDNDTMTITCYIFGVLQYLFQVLTYQSHVTIQWPISS